MPAVYMFFAQVPAGLTLDGLIGGITQAFPDTKVISDDYYHFRKQTQSVDEQDRLAKRPHNRDLIAIDRAEAGKGPRKIICIPAGTNLLEGPISLNTLYLSSIVPVDRPTAAQLLNMILSLGVEVATFWVNDTFGSWRDLA